MPKPMTLIMPDYTPEQEAALMEIGKLYPDDLCRRGRGAGKSAAIRQAVNIMLAMSPDELRQHIDGNYKTV